MNERVNVRGIDVDANTRCAHYHGPTDVIAIKFKCCGEYYACKDCHIALADHDATVWPASEWHEPAILCGVCRSILAIDAYMTSGASCPVCEAAFNSKCRLHYHCYFDSDAASGR